MSVFSQVALPNVVFETDSKINGKVLVVDKGKTRKLYAGGILQSVNSDSPIASRMYWGRIVDLINEELGGASKVLLLGLGGGAIAGLLTQKFPKVEIVGVELDLVVVDVARKYFALEEIPNLRIIVDDACRVVTSPEEYGLSLGYFDTVIVDIFVGEVYPELGNSGTFLAGVKKFLTQGGLVIFNRFYQKHHQDEVNDFIENVSEYFRDVKSLMVAGRTNSDNVLIYGFV